MLDKVSIKRTKKQGKEFILPQQPYLNLKASVDSVSGFIMFSLRINF